MKSVMLPVVYWQQAALADARLYRMHAALFELLLAWPAVATHSLLLVR